MKEFCIIEVDTQQWIVAGYWNLDEEKIEKLMPYIKDCGRYICYESWFYAKPNSKRIAQDIDYCCKRNGKQYIK